MAKKIHELPQTKGSFVIRGKVIGVRNKNFYTESTTQTGKSKRQISFGVQYEDGKTFYVSLQGFIRDKVYFGKREQNGTYTSKAIDWKDRNKSPEDGYRMMGVGVGLTKMTDENGRTKNDSMVMTEYDACEYIAHNLQDDMSVFVKGTIDYSSFINNNDDVVRRVDYTINSIYLTGDEIDFEADEFKPMHNFTQTIVFTNIEPEENEDGKTGRFVVEAKIVGYNTIENTTFIVTDKTLATQMKKGLKPYNSIEVSGTLDSILIVEEESDEDDDCWGTANTMKVVKKPVKRERTITGAAPSTIDKESYSENAIETALKQIHENKKAEKTFNGESWGNVKAIDVFPGDEDTPWD